MTARRLAAALFALCVLPLGACGGISSPSSNTTDQFSGTLQLGGTNSHTFSVQKTGEFEIRLTALAPAANTIVGVAFGQVFNSACEILPGYQNNFAQLNRSALAGPISKGTYCVIVFDSGLLTQVVTYTLAVSRP